MSSHLKKGKMALVLLFDTGGIHYTLGDGHVRYQNMTVSELSKAKWHYSSVGPLISCRKKTVLVLGCASSSILRNSLRRGVSRCSNRQTVFFLTSSQPFE